MNIITREDFLKKIQEFSRKPYRDLNIKILEMLEGTFKGYLTDNPYDTEVWLKFAMLYYISAFHDRSNAEICLKTILSYDPQNAYAILILFYIYEFESAVDDELFLKLCSIQHSDLKIMSMVEYAKSWYYSTHHKVHEHQQALINSINYYDGFLHNYVDLGALYIKNGYIVKGQALIKAGLKNLEYVYSNDENEPYNVFDFEDFFKERFQGVRLTQPNYEMLIESFDPDSFWISGKFVQNPDGTVSAKTHDDRDPSDIKAKS